MPVCDLIQTTDNFCSPTPPCFSPAFYRILIAPGKRIIFVTNNASKSRAQYKQVFDKLGIEAKKEEIFGSAFASAVYLSQILKFPKDKRVYVIGESGIEQELDEVGIQYTGGTVSVASAHTLTYAMC
jgi:ribonucleotide monophosphatase NagD (HAD superfamily)